MITAEEIQQPMQEDTEYFDATAAILALTAEVASLKFALAQQAGINARILALLQQRNEKPAIIVPTSLRELN